MPIREVVDRFYEFKVEGGRATQLCGEGLRDLANLLGKGAATRDTESIIVSILHQLADEVDGVETPKANDP